VSLALVPAVILRLRTEPRREAVIAGTIYAVLGVTALNWAGVEEGRWAQIVSTALKVVLLLTVVGVALAMPAGNAAGETEAAPLVAEPLTILTVLAGLQFVVAVYDGWYISIYFAGEDKDPGRNIPRSLFQSAIIVTLIYLAVNWALIRALDFNALRESTLPMATVIEAATGRWGSIIVALIAVLMALGTLNAVVMSNPRTLYGMAEDGLFVKSALRVNRGGTPTFALALGTALAIPLIYSGGYVFVFRLAGAMVLFGSCLFVLSYFALRKHRPDLARPYRAKGHPVLPAIALLINLALLIGFVVAEPISGAIMAGMIAICIPVGLHLDREKRQLAVTPV